MTSSMANSTIKDPFIDELRKRNYPSDIMIEACRIYDESTKNIKGTKKGTSRKRFYLFCIITAYNNLQKPYIEDVIINNLELTRSDINKAFRDYSAFQTGIKTPVFTSTPDKYIPIMCAKLNVNDVEGVLEYAKYICEIPDNNLDKENVVVVSTALVYAYIQRILQSPTIRNEEEVLKHLSSRSRTTVKNMAKRIIQLEESN